MIVVFIMIVAVLVTIKYSNQQIVENKKSTDAQIEKMQEQIEAIKNVAQDHINKTEELKRQHRSEEFTASLKVLDTELEYNLSMLNKIRNNIDKGFTYHSLNYSLVTLLLYKPSTVEFGGKTLYQSLLSVRTRIESFNLVYSRAEAFLVQRKLTQNEIDQIEDKINQTEYMIALCRALIRKFEQDNSSLLQEQTYDNFEKALKLEKTYREENPKTAYEKLKKEIKL